jgi:hypothetical protein
MGITCFNISLVVSNRLLFFYSYGMVILIISRVFETNLVSEAEQNKPAIVGYAHHC